MLAVIRTLQAGARPVSTHIGISNAHTYSHVHAHMHAHLGLK